MSLPAETLPEAFESHLAPVNGTVIRFVRGGSGPAIILIHGFPQDWFEYHAVMEPLAKHFTVVALDLRGVGLSAPTASGYDAANLAEDVFQLVSALKLKDVYIVGHDIGGMVAYAFVRSYPQAARGVMILDTPIPGIDGWEEAQRSPAAWHVHFMQTPELPEKLVTGRQSDYFRYFFNFGKFTPGEVDHHLGSYRAPEQLRALFEMYRALPANAEFNATHSEPNDVPLFYAGGGGSPFVEIVPKVAAGLRARGFTNVETGVITGAVHYAFQDQPGQMIDLIKRYASSNRGKVPLQSH